MKTSRLLLVLAVAVLGFTALATAEGMPASYMALKGGIYSPSQSYDVENYYDSNKSHLDSKTGFSAEIAVGHYFMPMLAVEFGAGYFESEGSAAAQPGTTELKVIPLLATGKVFLPLGLFEPYGLAGIGAYITDLKVDGNSGDFNGSTEVTYGLHAGAGININLDDSLFVGVEGKYLWAEPSFGGQHVKLNGFLSTAVLGFRY